MRVKTEDERLIEALMSERDRLKVRRRDLYDEIAIIRRDLKQLTYVAVAQKFEIDPSTVKRIDMGAW